MHGLQLLLERASNLAPLVHGRAAWRIQAAGVDPHALRADVLEVVALHDVVPPAADEHPRVTPMEGIVDDAVAGEHVIEVHRRREPAFVVPLRVGVPDILESVVGDDVPTVEPGSAVIERL